MPAIVAGKPDLLDWAAAAFFALASVVLGVWGFWMMLSLVVLPLGLLIFIVAILAWYAAKGVFSRDREAWWVSLLVTMIGIVVWIPEVLWSAGVFRVLPAQDLVYTVGAFYLLTYLVLRRDRYGIGRRLPASMTLG
ncbi:MAG: hypothetical protein E6K16_03370 [Methanobacteriota archaeon]|nr:MAG: hypothetical protein E6K16_03370 [Euryarchaeota archaeon]